MRRTTLGENLLLGLGLFSIGLGVAEIFASRRAAQRNPLRRLARAFSMRKASKQMNFLGRKSKRYWNKSKAIMPFRSRRSDTTKIAVASVVGVACAAGLGYVAAKRFRNRADKKRVHVKETITINRSAEDLYDFWRHFDRLPIIMNHLESVEAVGENRTHWVAKAPAGTHVEWDAEIINEHPNELIAWRSLEGADVENAGSVRFEPAPGGRGTIVKVDLDYIPPAGAVGAKIAKLFGESPEKQISVDLRRFKQLMETGEISRTEGQPAGRASSTSKKYDDFVRT